jgi:sulfopyruvate decarboxylase subunit beta
VALSRFAWLSVLASRIPEDALVVMPYVGAVSFEWEGLDEGNPRTAQLGQMGDVLGLAVGLALALPQRKVVCIEADGSLLLELGQLVLLGQEAPANLSVFVVDNGAYETIGSGPGGARPTATAAKTDLAKMALAAGVPYAVRVGTMNELEREIDGAIAANECRFIDVETSTGPAEVAPFHRDGFEEKYRFVRYIERIEGKRILTLRKQGKDLMRSEDWNKS